MTQKNTILIVDDIQSNLILLDKILTDEGYIVISASNGDEAIRCTQEHEFDLILLDIMMPMKDGFTVFRELKSKEKSANIPVIFITVINNESDTLKAFELGAVDYITKPYTPTELRIRVKTQIELVNAHKNRVVSVNPTKSTNKSIEQNPLLEINSKLIDLKDQIQNLKNAQLNAEEKLTLAKLKDEASEILKLLKTQMG